MPLPHQSSILTVNGGSSSLKFAVFKTLGHPQRTSLGLIERIGQEGSRLIAKSVQGTVLDDRREPVPSLEAAAALVVDWLQRHSGGHAPMAAIGHRVVHGGSLYDRPVLITKEVLDALRAVAPLDPDHLPGELALIDAFRSVDPDLPQVACFDTAFHRDLPRVARIIPIPRKYEALGVRKYGFHGLSYAYLMEELRRSAGEETAEGRVILAHLGSGASLAAVKGGRCVETTMAFTPNAGIVMGTRSGDIDPGLVQFLTRAEGMTADRFQTMTTRESGLLGISETSSDVRDLLASQADDVRAAEAIEVFCYRIKAAIGALAAVLGGLDTVVFSGGIGENSPEIRRRAVANLDYLGIRLDDARNQAGSAIISANASPVTVHVIPTDEESVIARETMAVLDSSHGASRLSLGPGRSP